MGVTTPTSENLRFPGGGWHGVSWAEWGEGGTPPEPEPEPNPVPALTSIDPTSMVAFQEGDVSDDLPFAAIGTGFTPESRIRFAGVVEPTTTFVDETRLRLGIQVDLWTGADVVQVSVVTPAPGGGESGSLPFAITEPDSPEPEPEPEPEPDPEPETRRRRRGEP